MKKYVLIADGAITNLILMGDNDSAPESSLEVTDANMSAILALGAAENFFPATPTYTPSLEDSAAKYIGFGGDLFQTMARKVWAKNVYLKSIGQDPGIEGLQSLLVATTAFRDALTTGSLLTAKSLLQSLQGNFGGIYSDIATYGVTQINTFLGIS